MVRTQSQVVRSGAVMQMQVMLLMNRILGRRKTHSQVDAVQVRQNIGLLLIGVLAAAGDRPVVTVAGTRVADDAVARHITAVTGHVFDDEQKLNLRSWRTNTTHIRSRFLL